MLKRSLSLGVALFAFAGMAAGQTGPSLSFIDRWGEDASRFVEYDFARVRLTDPSLDVSGQRDTVDVTVSVTLGTDVATVTLTETGNRTGVFEGGVDLRLNQGPPAFSWALETAGTPTSFDTLQVSASGGLFDTAEVVPSILRLVDDQGDEVTDFAAGGRVFVRLVDRHSDTTNPDTTTVTLTTNGGDSEVVILAETAVSGGEFTGSIQSRIAAGTPTPGDGFLDTLADETLTASHEDVNHVSFSTATAAFAGITLRFVDSRGVPTSTTLEGAKITLQAISASANLDPLAVEQIPATLTSQLGGDLEAVSLIETGTSTSVFEGRIRVTSYTPVVPGNTDIQVSPSLPVPETIEASSPGAAPATIHPSGSSTRLLDVWGNDAETFPRGGTLRVRVEDHMIDTPYYSLQSTGVQLLSLTTGDEEHLILDETGIGSNVYEGSLPLEIGPAIPEDGKLQAQADGEVLEARHDDWNAATASEDTGRLSPAEMWFLDDDGRPTETVLENGTLRLRLFDSFLSTPGAADIASEVSGDGENLFFSAVPGSPGSFEGSMPTEHMTWGTPTGNGILATRYDDNSLNGLDTISAFASDTSASARAAFSELAFVDSHGNETGSFALGEALHVRLRSGAPGTTGVDQIQILLLSQTTGDSETMTLTESGADTNIYQGSFPTGTGTASPSNGRLQVRIGEVVAAEDHRADRSIAFVLDTAVITASRVTFVDRQNAPTEIVFRNSRARFEAFDLAANLDSGTIDSRSLTILSYREGNGQLFDLETLDLIETGPDTALFRGSIRVSSDTAGTFGVLDTSFYSPYEGLDRLRVEIPGGSSDAAELTDAVVRFLDGQGNDASIYQAGDLIRIRLIREASNVSPVMADTVSVFLFSWIGRAATSQSYDSLSLGLTETGPDTGVFEGEIEATAARADFTDSIFQILPGGEIGVEIVGNWAEDADRAFMVGSANQPPVAEDDTVTTPEDTPVTIDLLANDSDPEGQPLTITQVIPYGSGGLQVHPDGTRTYIPNPNFNGGPEVYVYEVSDGSLTAFATLRVFVTPVNDPPVASNNSATVPEDSFVQINVLANDTDVDGDTLAILSFTQGTKGSVTASGAGLLYTPNLNANGADSFTYTVRDPAGATATATVSVTITPVNDPPVAVANSVTINEDTSVTISVLANDSDVDGDALTVSAATQGSHGSVSRQTLAVIYTPATNYFGTDSFTYTASDGKGGTAVGTVSVTITPVNDVPVAVNNSAATNEDTPVTVNVLANDSDADGDPLTITNVTQGLKGTVTVNAGASVTYTPNLNANGSDSFTYTISDGKGGTRTATVTMTIVAVNDPPNAVSDARTTPEDTAINIAVLANDSEVDGQTLTVTAVTQGTNGSVVLNADKTVTYTPGWNFFGSDSFTYTVSDGTLTATATVSISVTDANDPPYAVEDQITLAEDETISFYVLSNDSDPEGNTIYVSSVLPAKNGVVSGPGLNHVLTYTPKPNFHGEDFFVYTVSDTSFGTNSATVMITVTPVDDAPVAVNDAATVAEDAPATAVNVLANDTDVDGGTKSVDSVTQPANGTVVITGGGTGLTYQPDANFCTPGAPATFTYTLTPDGSTATVSMTVTCSDDAPAAVNDVATVNEDSGANAIDVLANDTDPDGGSISITSVTQPANGTVVITGGGTGLTYQPNANFCTAGAPETFTCTLTPGGSSTTVSLTVTCVDDNPTAVADAATVMEDSGANAMNVLANDTDADGGPISIQSVTQPANGTVVITGGGTGLTYQSNANFCTPGAPETFTYTLAPGGSSTTVTVSVTCVDDNPTAVADAATVNEDSGVNAINVLANDTDPDGGSIDITSVTQPVNGTVVITGGGTGLTYEPNANFCTSETFTYTLSPGGSTATVSVTVTCADDDPTAVADTATVNEDSGANGIDVLANDTDADGGPISIQSVTQPANGTVVITGGGTGLAYTPNANYCNNPPGTTPDTFTYTLMPGGSATVVTVTVTCVNDAPDATNDSASTNEDSAVFITVLDNDTDVEGDLLIVSSVTQGTKGVATVNGGGTITYTPNANANGSDSFTYTASDGNATDTATVSVTINGVNDVPDAVNDAASTNEDNAVTITVLGNDTDADGNVLTVSAVTQGTKGAVTINGGGTITYTPNANANGTDLFTYTVSDGNGGSDTATVSVTINVANDLPVAAGNSASTNEDTAVLINVLANDSDPDGDVLTVSAATQGTKGAVTINVNGTITYTPNANANGSDSFTYTVSDGTATANATVSVNITGVNDAPDAVNDAAATVEDAAVIITVLANDTDADGETLQVTGVTQGSKGAVTINANGTVAYTPAPNTNGADAFTYTVRDGANVTDTATVTVSVAPVNDAPVAVADTATTREGAAVTITVLANDSDVEGNTLTVTSVTTLVGGTAVVNANNTVTYTAGANFNGIGSFIYTLSDGQGGTATATVTVTVTDALERVAVLATHGIWIQTGADVLSGDVIVNQTGATPFLDAGSSELSIAGTVTTPAGYDVQANRVNVASGTAVASDAFYNQRTGAGTVTGAQTSPLTLPVFATLPAFLTATPGATDVSVATNGTRTLAAGSYRDLIVGRKGTVTFTGGTYHFRTVQVDREAKLFFSAASTIRVQQKMSVLQTSIIKPATGATIDGSDIVFHIAGANGTTGTLAATPKTVEIGVDNVVWANIYAPNGTIWMKDRTQVQGVLLGKDVQVGPDVQVTLDSSFTGQ
jgi:VCBS repeat-containing protein